MKKNHAEKFTRIRGVAHETRTHTLLPTQDFKSCTSTIPSQQHMFLSEAHIFYHIFHDLSIGKVYKLKLFKNRFIVQLAQMILNDYKRHNFMIHITFQVNNDKILEIDETRNNSKHM